MTIHMHLVWCICSMNRHDDREAFLGGEKKRYGCIYLLLLFCYFFLHMDGRRFSVFREHEARRRLKREERNLLAPSFIFLVLLCNTQLTNPMHEGLSDGPHRRCHIFHIQRISSS